MSQKSKRHKNERSGVDLDFRAFTVNPSTINEAERSVEGIIATETPVMEMDWDRYEKLPRTLLMSGADYPTSRQIPMLDCHQRYSLGDQLGSIRNVRVEGDKLVGRLVFSETAEDEWKMVREGHVTDISLGFQILRQVFVPEKTTQKIGGRDFTGPCNVATKWRAYEGSLTPIGADDQCKMRGLDPSNLPQQEHEEFDMKPELRAFLLTRGMPTDLDDDKAQEWIVANPDKLGERKEPSGNPGQKTGGAEFKSDDILRALDQLAQDREKARADERAKFRAEVDASCELADAPVDFARTLYDLPDITAVRTKIKEHNVQRAKNASPGLGFGGPRITGEGRTEFRKAVLTSMLGRVFRGNSADDTGNGVSQKTQDAILPASERSKGSTDFDGMPITEIARRCLVADGCHETEVRRLDNFGLATAVFRSPEEVGLERRDFALHNTASFAYLTEAAMNKGMRAGNMEAKTTYQKVCNFGEPAKDFKKKNVYTTSAVGNLTVWPDGQKPDLRSFMDYKDSYGVEAYAMMLEYTWQLFVNDDMGVIVKSPFKLGDACARSVNAFFWAIITANGALADGQALFLAAASGNRKKANYISSGLVPTVASIGALEELMRQQVGQNTREGNAGPDILSIEPKYLIVPTAVVRNTAMAIVRSIADPASANANVHNPYQGTLEVIQEPLLAANSATAWYMAADPALVDGIEISFLQGFEKPRTWSGRDEKTLSMWYAIAQVWGGKAIDHRGWAKQAGA